MIPVLVPRNQLLAANGIFTLTLNAAFALGFALLGPLVVNVAGPRRSSSSWRACTSSPRSSASRSRRHLRRVRAQEPRGGSASAEAERAVGSTFAQLREGVEFIRANRAISWSLLYLGITASLVGVLGVLGPDFAEETLGLAAEGLRRRRPAARVRHRDGHPAAQLLRPATSPAGG